MHEGHRSRFTAKLLDGSTFYDHEIVEIILYNACPRRDLNAVAHRLIDRFGSVGGVLSASAEELTEVEGVGANIADYIRVLGLCLNRCKGSAGFGLIRNTEEFCNFMSARPHKADSSLELYVLDKDDRVRRISSFSTEESFEGQVIALLTASRAYGVFAAHIRKGNSLPIAKDGEVLKALAPVCRSCAVRLYDFCISGDDGAYSYFIHGELSGDRVKR